MKSNLPIRNSVRIILLNNKNEVLLMCINDPKTTSIGEKSSGPFWALIGGDIKTGETVIEAARREAFEETGLKKENIKFGPIVWYGELELMLYGKPTYIKEQYIVAKTNKTEVFLNNLTADEKNTVKKLSWFSPDQIKKSKEIIYPIILSKYLPDLIKGNYPVKLINIINPDK